jgi:hypothetical protein
MADLHVLASSRGDQKTEGADADQDAQCPRFLPALRQGRQLLDTRRLLRPSARIRQTKVRPARKPVFTDLIEAQPPSFPCAKRQLSIVSTLKRQSLPT